MENFNVSLLNVISAIVTSLFASLIWDIINDKKKVQVFKNMIKEQIIQSINMIWKIVLNSIKPYLKDCKSDYASKPRSQKIVDYISVIAFIFIFAAALFLMVFLTVNLTFSIRNILFISLISVSFIPTFRMFLIELAPFIKYQLNR